MANGVITIRLPEPEWKPLRDADLLYFKDRFRDDNAAWNLLVKHWGITLKHNVKRTFMYGEHGEQDFPTLEYERAPVYPAWAKTIKLRKEVNDGKDCG